MASAPPRTLRPITELDRPRRRPSVTLVIVVLTVAATALRLYRLRFGYAHGIIDYDSGVYFGSSLELVNGQLPYRDFVFVHPPVITILMTPVALLSKAIGTGQAMGIAKILTGLAGAASVPLTGWLVRRRGVLAVAVACGVVAFQGDAVASGYSLLLEPWLVLFCLLGAVLVFDGDEVADGRRLWWGGVLFGIACATKIWAVAPVLAVVLICLPHRRRLVRYLAGVATGFLVPVLPFLVASPGAFVHQVFTVQIFRSSDARTELSQRVIHLFSVAAPNGEAPSTSTAALLAGAIGFVVLLTLVWLRRVRGSTPLERFGVLAAVFVAALFLAPDTFYWHYSAFSTPFLALAATLPLSWLRPRWRRAWAALLVCCVVGLGFTIVHRDLRWYAIRDEFARVDAVVPAGACVVTSMASSTIADNRFFADRADCPVFLDSFGAVLDLTDGQSPSPAALRDPDVRRLWLRLYQRADYLYLKQRVSPTIPSDSALRAYLRDHFHVVPVDVGGRLYARNGLSP